MPNSAKMNHNKKRSILFNQTSYITSEIYHALNQNSSEIYIIKSTSTLFYDLDALAKRHSYHFVPEYPISETRKIAKKKTEISHKNAFGAKSETIVQECAAQIKPKLKRHDSLKIAAKRIKKRSFNDSVLSSEIFLRDNDYTKRKSEPFIKNDNDLRQKFWSYAKYQTQYTNPLSETKKCKKKDRGKRTEDPCPCQLFSYACPCTDKKSLTELARNSKSLTVADQITSTPNFLQQEYQKYCKNKKSKCSSFYEDKPTNTNITGFIKPYEMTAVNEETIINKEIPKFSEDKGENITSCVKNGIKVESRPHKKSKQVICPNCKEPLEILSTDDEGSLKSKKSLNYHVNQTLSPLENQNFQNNNMDENDSCIHNPPCELVPVCQILPINNINYNMNPKCVRRVSVPKHNPKTIRITKACRHHPPCIVVPSCQRLNVLKNNCEFVPPCLHRPRCVNVPLCVPFSRSLCCEGILNKTVEEPDHIECAYFPPSKMMSAYKQKSPNHSNQTCEYVSECSPRFILNPQMQGMSPTFSTYNQSNHSPCQCCKTSKSCQYDGVGCECIPRGEVKEYGSNDDIIYIRDVGCQFRSENFTQKDSLLQSKTSSASFDLTSAKAGNYYSNYHTLRYEDKCTCPISGEGEVSLSNFTTSSLEIDAQCPSHGIQACNQRDTGFKPQPTASPFVAAFSTYKDPILQYQHIVLSDETSQVTSKSDSIDMLTYLTTFPVKSRRSFLKGKRKKVFSIRRRRKSNRNNTSNSSRMNKIEYKK